MFVVIENTPGYLPESDDPLVTEDYSLAVEHANSLADQLEEQGYTCDRSLASSGNYYAISCTDGSEHDLGRRISVEVVDEAWR